jgi:hypothetical protein
MVMNKHDSLSSVLREWATPEPSGAMDARVRAAYKARYRASWWRRFLSARVSIPVPVLAALLVIVTAFWLQFRAQPPRPGAVAPTGEGYMTRIEAAGFKPLPDGETRVIRSGGVKQ